MLLKVDPSKGTASAKVVGLIKKAKATVFDAPTPAPFAGDGWYQTRSPAKVAEQTQQYIAVNGLDDRCAECLWSLSDAQKEWVINAGGMFLKVDPSKGTASAKVVGFIKKARSMVFNEPTPPPWEVAARLQQYIAVNGLDDRCAQNLWSITDAQKEWVMNAGGMILKVDPSKGTASAKVVGFIKKA